MKNEIPTRGSLNDYSLSQILTHITTKRETGILILQNKDIMKLIYIENGYIIDYLSLTLSNIKRHKEAEQSILKAIELEPYNADYHVHMGLIYLKAGLKKRAQQQFETALEWDSTNENAMRELKKLKTDT